VLIKRYGLGTDTAIQTLEAIGQTYGITRERVRQIENYGIQSIQKSPTYDECQEVFEELRQHMHELGAMIAEDDLLAAFAKDASTRNHLFFLFVLGSAFSRNKENAAFRHRWYVEKQVAESVERALQRIFDSLGEDELVSEAEILARLRTELQDLEERYHDDVILRRWLAISKGIGCNPLGEWGPAQSPNVRTKGVRDYAYLAVKRHGSPMHYREVAATINELFGRPAHIATTHNELIKDSRFVLVGRGLYALAEWGYSAGVVKDVLREILEKHGPLTRQEIIDRMKKERYVKDNTIVVNLQDTNIFKHLPGGQYMVVTD
jgi:hypothetical protein